MAKKTTKNTKEIKAKKKYVFTPANERFCEHFAEFGNYTQAYLFAYPNAVYSTANSKGSELGNKPPCVERIAQLQEEFAISVQQSKERTIKDLLITAEEARKDGKYNDYAKLRDMIIKMCGFYEPEKQQIEHKGITFNYITPIEDKKKNDD